MMDTNLAFLDKERNHIEGQINDISSNKILI